MTTQELKPSVIWLMLASLIGFLVSAVFSMGLRWERSLFLVPYITIIGIFLGVYFWKQPISLKQLLGPWRMGLVGVAVATLFLIWKVQGYPPSAVPEGIQLVLAIIWIGIAYGVVDGLLLNVMPVLIVHRVWPGEADTSRPKLLTRGFLALMASIFVTIAYHLGYTEFHGFSIFWVIIGNSIITSTYLLTGSPLSAIVTHVIMHIAAVLHGMETVLMLPPHYPI
jgi:hypothetical protein